MRRFSNLVLSSRGHQVTETNSRGQVPAAIGLYLGLEATGGFEPPNRGFADLRLRPLGYVAELDEE